MKKMRIIGAVIAAVSALSMGISIPASAATTDTSVEITANNAGLTVTSNASLVLLCNPACTVSATAQTASSAITNVSNPTARTIDLLATDARGTGAGWNLTATMNNFVNANGDVIPVASATTGGTSQFEFDRTAITVDAGQPAWVVVSGITDETTTATTTTTSSLNATGVSNIYSLAQAAGQGSIGRVAVTNGGSGYSSAPTVAITGSGCVGVTAEAVVSGGSVTAVNVTNAGSGCTGIPTVAFSGVSGSGATANAVRGAGEGAFDKVLENIELTIPPLTRAGTYNADFTATII